MATEERTARFTILVDPRKKAVFEKLCAQEDATPSQVVRRLMRAYIEERLGRLGVPVVIGLPFGHAPTRNAALAFGVAAQLDADQGALEQLDPLPVFGD